MGDGAALVRELAGRRFIVGDRFTAADLAFACMLIAPSGQITWGLYD